MTNKIKTTTVYHFTLSLNPFLEWWGMELYTVTVFSSYKTKRVHVQHFLLSCFHIFSSYTFNTRFLSWFVVLFGFSLHHFLLCTHSVVGHEADCECLLLHALVMQQNDMHRKLHGSHPGKVRLPDLMQQGTGAGGMDLGGRSQEHGWEPGLWCRDCSGSAWLGPGKKGTWLPEARAVAWGWQWLCLRPLLCH